MKTANEAGGEIKVGSAVSYRWDEGGDTEKTRETRKAREASR